MDSKQSHGFGSSAERLNNATKCRTETEANARPATATTDDCSDDEDEELGAQSQDKMKTILMSLWNNVKFGL